MAQVIVSDAYVDFTASRRTVRPDDAERITISYPWVEGESYDIELLLSSGDAVEDAGPGSRTAAPA